MSGSKIKLPFSKAQLPAAQLIEMADRFEAIVLCMESTHFGGEEKKRDRLIMLCENIAKDYSSYNSSGGAVQNKEQSPWN